MHVTGRRRVGYHRPLGKLVPTDQNSAPISVLISISLYFNALRQSSFRFPSRPMVSAFWGGCKLSQIACKRQFGLARGIFYLISTSPFIKL